MTKIAAPRKRKGPGTPISPTITEVDGSHMIMLSHPETVADVILTAAAAVDRQPICGGEIADMSIFERVHIPSLGGATEWLNSEPLGPAGLKAWRGAK